MGERNKAAFPLLLLYDQRQIKNCTIQDTSGNLGERELNGTLYDDRDRNSILDINNDFIFKIIGLICKK